MTRIVIALVVLLFGISCRNSIPFAGAYVLDESRFGLKLELDLKRDGSYHAISNSRMGPLEEEGTWQAERGDLILRRTSGGLDHPVRRLRPDEQRAGYLLWIVPGGENQGAVTYFSFKPKS